MSAPEETSVEDHGQADHGHGEHHEESFIRKYIFSQDHKVIGIQYGLTALCFLLFGFCLMILMRWQLASPGAPIPWIGGWLGEANAPGGIMLPEFYNQLGAMHGTIMVFLAVVPMIVGAFGNYVVPLQIGAPDMAFPKLNMASYWVYFIGGVIMLVSFFLPGGALADRDGLPDHVVVARLDEHHRHHLPAARSGHDLDAIALHGLVAAGDLLPAAAGVPAARGGRHSAVDGQRGRHQLLHAEWAVCVR